MSTGAIRHLGGWGIRPIAKASLVGTVFPICCFGSLPVAVSLYQKEGRLGPVLAFGYLFSMV